MEEVFNAISDDADARRLDHNAVTAIWAMGCAAFAAVKVEGALVREPGRLMTEEEFLRHGGDTLKARLVPVRSPQQLRFRAGIKVDQWFISASNGEWTPVSVAGSQEDLDHLVEWINDQLDQHAIRNRGGE